jgi:8-oxo-dGTP pyrophosphatase MutT (NUDIX family)
MPLEYSFGIIPFYIENSKFQYLVVQNIQDKFWGFPKGHPENHELEIETATRELFEETGIKLKKIFQNITSEETYTYLSNKRAVTKKVKYYTGLTDNKKVLIQKNELSSYVWLEYELAIKKISYPTSKKCLEKN